MTEVFLAHEKEFEKNQMGKKAFVSQSIKLRPTIKMVAHVAGVRGGKEHGHTERIRRYLEILVDGLLNHEGYTKEVSTWDSAGSTGALQDFALLTSSKKGTIVTPTKLVTGTNPALRRQ